MRPRTNELKTTELIDLYPDLMYPGTPYSVKSVWDRKIDEWHDATPGSPQYISVHNALLQLRYFLIAHHVEVTHGNTE